MADDDDVGTTASGGEEVAGQVKSMFKFGSGKQATLFAKALEQSRRTLDDDDLRHVADFASGGRASDPRHGFADPEWELPEYIAQRDELLASWRETYGFRTGSVNPYAALRNKMDEANFILRWEQEHFGRLLRTTPASLPQSPHGRVNCMKNAISASTILESKLRVA
jgi:hypothetical protein